MRPVRLGPLLGAGPADRRECQLRTDDGRLLVIMTGTGQVVAEHFLVPPGEASVRDEHYGGPRPASPRRAVRPKTAAEKEFCALGPVAEVFITGAAAAGHTRLRTGAGRAEHAARRSRRAGVRSPRWTARSRSAGGVPPTCGPSSAPAPACPGPQTEPGDALVLDLPVVPVRPLADYALGGLS